MLLCSEEKESSYFTFFPAPWCQHLRWKAEEADIDFGQQLKEGCCGHHRNDYEHIVIIVKRANIPQHFSQTCKILHAGTVSTYGWWIIPDWNRENLAKRVFFLKELAETLMKPHIRRSSLQSRLQAAVWNPMELWGAASTRRWPFAFCQRA